MLFRSLSQQVSDLLAQLEAAAVPQPTPHDFERLAAERDAAREEISGLQERVRQAEGGERLVAAKMRDLEREAARWKAQAEAKNDLLLKSEGANNALQIAIINVVREVSCNE